MVVGSNLVAAICTCFIPFSSISIVDIEQVNVSWAILSPTNFSLYLNVLKNSEVLIHKFV